MGSKSIVRARGLDDLRSTPLGDVADALVSYLVRRHLAWHVAEGYLRAAAHFARWLGERGVRASRTSVHEFWSRHISRCRCAGRANHSRIVVRAALGHFVRVLRAAGHFDDERPSRTPVDDEMDRFESYLRETCGAAASTRARRRLDAGQFLRSVFGDDPKAYIAQWELIERRNQLYEARQVQQYGKEAFLKELKGPIEEAPGKAGK